MSVQLALLFVIVPSVILYLMMEHSRRNFEYRYCKLCGEEHYFSRFEE